MSPNGDTLGWNYGPMQGDQEQGDRPEPRNVGEAMRRINRTLPQILETCDLVMHHPDLEYDQGDHVTVKYDTAFDLAEAFYAVVGVANRQERAIRHALDLHGPEHPATAVLKEALPDAG